MPFTQIFLHSRYRASITLPRLSLMVFGTAKLKVLLIHVSVHNKKMGIVVKINRTKLAYILAPIFPALYIFGNTVFVRLIIYRATRYFIGFIILIIGKLLVMPVTRLSAC